jgi:hypothetical protein
MRWETLVRNPVAFACLSLTVCGIALADAPGIDLHRLTPVGERYEASVPDTLDLAERARLSVHGLTSFLNPDAGYAPYGHTYFNGNPPYMSDMPGGPPNWGKIIEDLIMARQMCGSEENLDITAKSIEGMLASTWMTINPVAPTPVSRAMLGLMAAYQLDSNPALKERIVKMADEHCSVATYKDNYAFYSDLPEDTRETSLGVLGHWMEAFVTGCAIRPLSRWSMMTGDLKYLETSGKLKTFLVQPRLWAPEAGPKVVHGFDHAQFSGHHHSYTQALMGLLWYGQATNDVRLKEFVRDGYEYMRTFGIARIGLFGEGCTTGDMTYLALKLSNLGVGDYWDDADGYIRNHLAELQITDAEKFKKAVAEMPEGRGKNDTTTGAFDPKNESADNIIERNIGVFLSDSTHPTLIPDHSFLYTICCTGNCTVAMYAAWESIVRCTDGVAQVNLLLNRASPWLDIDSYLPYEGKVVIRNKNAKKIAVRIPVWVDKAGIKCRKNGAAVLPYGVGQYIVFDDVAAKDEITITFPVHNSTETYSLKWKQSEFWKESTNPGPNWTPDPPVVLTCTFRGNTLMDISPRSEGKGLPLYQRDELKRDAASMKTVKRFVPNVILQW